MENNEYNVNCFLNKEKQIDRFVPEINIKEEKITQEIYQEYFPKLDNEDNYNKLRISNIGLYSITKPKISKKICKIIFRLIKTKDITVTDAFGNTGGMTIMLARYFSYVNTCEIVPQNCNILKNNIKVYGLQDKVNIICGDYLDYMLKFKQDVIFFDPPWGGTNYNKIYNIHLGIDNVNISCIINKLIGHVKYILLKVPYNYNLNDLKYINNNKIIYTLNKHKINSQILIIILGNI